MAKPGSHGAVDWDAVYTAHGQAFLSNTPTDNYFTGNPTLDYLKADGAQLSGGDYLIEPLIHTGQTSGTSVARGEQFGLTTVDPVTAAQFRITEYVMPVTIFGLDEVRAGGTDSRLNLVETYITNARLSAERLMSQHLWAASQAKATDLNPIPVLIPAGGAGTIGGIDSSTYTFWKSQSYATITFSTGGLDKMRTIINDCSAGNQGKRPGLIVTTQAIWEAYGDLAENANVLQTTPGAAGQRVADLGFPVLYYQGIPITWDPNCPSGKMYFLNKEGIKLRMLGKGWTLSPFQSVLSNGVDARVAVLRCFCQVTVSHRRILGQLSSIT